MEAIGSEQKFSGSFFTPLLISLAGIVGASAAIVAYHVILVKFCRQRRAGRSTTTRLQSNGPAARDQGIIGVEEHVLKAIPIYCYDESTDTNDQNECVICLGELTQGDNVRLLPYCRHLFHVSCIDDWFLAHTICPICRAPIVAPISSVIHEPVIDAHGDHDDTDHDHHGHVHGVNDHYSSTSRDTCRLLQHSVSLVLPRETKTSERLMGLKRSLSMDQCYVAIDIQREMSDQKASCTCSSSSSASKGRSYGARSMRQLDRIMSSRLLRSFSQLRIGGRGTSSSNAILPY